jgi:DNA polymerase-3 subunit alpha
MSQHEFVHLHVHTEYSLLDGLSDMAGWSSTPKRWRCRRWRSPPITRAMFGVIDFYRSARKASMQAIVGMEGYLAPRGMRDEDSRLDKSPFHLLMLAMKDDEGCSQPVPDRHCAQLDGYYYKPRVDREALRLRTSDGLIVTSGCLAAQIPSMVMEGRDDAARELLDWYLQVFGRERSPVSSSGATSRSCAR